MERAMHRLPFAESILHPTDLSEESKRAFAHALAMALRNKASLAILHVGKGRDARQWKEFPSVRGTLERWGLLEEGSARAEVFRNLDVRVKKVTLKSKRPVPAVLDYLEEHTADLVVLATEGREGLTRLVRPSTAEAIARRAEARVLFVPRSARSFVSQDDGSLLIERVLVPVDRHPDPGEAVASAMRISAVSARNPVGAIALHVGPGSSSPKLDLPASEFCSWSEMNGSGDVVSAIVRAASDRSADLIVMATEGHRGVLDALRGSVAEQVLRNAPCPVLAVPARTGLV
jgi:nucleotide-binding universal stress UspA family protein